LLQRKVPGIDYDMPNEWRNAPAPKYSWESIQWAKDLDEARTIERALAAAKAGDLDELELALVYLSNINICASSGQLIMVSV
jgi:hypothetical protein